MKQKVPNTNAILGIALFIVAITNIGIRIISDNYKDRKIVENNVSIETGQEQQSIEEEEIKDIDLVEIVDQRLDSNQEFGIKIKNNSNKTLESLRIDIYYFDENGVNIGSDFTNNRLKKVLSGGTLILYESCSVPLHASYTMQISSVRFSD